MATIQDLEQEVQDLDVDVIGEEVAIEPETPAVEEPEIPEKYRGKSAAEIIKMHQEAEKLVDRQAQEVGEVRKLADDLLKSQLYSKPETKQPEKVDFFENPEEAVRQAVDNHPKVIAAEQFSQLQGKERAKQTLVQLHPDFSEIVTGGEFQNWVKSSPVRTRLFMEAENYDVEAANELLSTYKALHPKEKQDVEVDKTARKQAMNAASVDTGGSSETTRKVYRRADLIRLKLSNPAKYEAMQDDIDRAYQEGRVK